MQGLAEFVMKGRKQAIIAVMLLGLIPLIYFLGPVLVALIVLRKGVREGAMVLAWAILPIGAWAYAGDLIPLIMLLGVFGLASLLRESESWELTLIAAIAVGACVEINMRLQPLILDTAFQQLELYTTANNLQGLQLEELREQTVSFIGAIYMFLALVLLVVARWLQATLYNPGGFQSEFHSLRVEQKIALLLLGLYLLINFVGVVPGAWVIYLFIPLVFSGLALIHSVVKKKQLSNLWLKALYVLLMFPIVLQLVVLLALVDSWYDFRKRLVSKETG